MEIDKLQLLQAASKWAISSEDADRRHGPWWRHTVSSMATQHSVAFRRIMIRADLILGRLYVYVPQKAYHPATESPEGPKYSDTT